MFCYECQKIAFSTWNYFPEFHFPEKEVLFPLMRGTLELSTSQRDR